MRCALLDDQLAHPIGGRVDILDIEIEAEGIVLDLLRPSLDLVEVEMPAAAVGEDAVMAVIARTAKPSRW
jgi:hypothetical protein